mmetsp:Transcript_64353/g.140099  ORF Transcript_64353/g.140099 Transcript_64353/m.140099 type:complete len:93 (+) Transcript_64353:2-280(+)
MPRVLEGAARFLMSCEALGGVGLVRLHGQSRSAAVLCAFLIVSRGLSVDQAWSRFQEAKIEVDPALVMWDALRHLPASVRAIQDAQMEDAPA